MSTSHALLGLLLERPGYPYDLGDRLRRRLGPAWRVNSGQLYQSIERLERDGLIARLGAPSARDGRRMFAITPSGAREFERWFLRTPDPGRRARRPLHVKITLGGPSRLPCALEQLESCRRARGEALARLVREREEVAPGPGPVRADRCMLALNLEAEILQVEAEIRWAARAAGLIAWLMEQEAVWPRARGGGPEGRLAQAAASARRRGEENDRHLD